MTLDAREPRPGRMHVEQVRLITGETGIDLVIPGRSVPEVFAARLMDGSDTLEITWTESIGRGTIANPVAKAEELAGGPGRPRRIVAYASASLRDRMSEGRFEAEPFALALGRRLGGTWEVEIIPRPNSIPPTWNIIITRLGGSP